MLSVVECFEFLSQVPVLGHDLDLVDEDAEIEASLLLVHILVLLLLIVE